MRPAETYRAARRNERAPGQRWLGIPPGVYPRKAHNAAKLRRPHPVAVVIPTLLEALMKRTGMWSFT